MSFKHSVIGDNNAENREHLELLGYKVVASNDECGDTLFTFESGIADAADASDITIVYSEDTNDCRSNPPLFRALTAVRDDSNINKYFTNGSIFIKSKYEDYKKYIDDYYRFRGANPDEFREVTEEELMEYFK